MIATEVRLNTKHLKELTDKRGLSGKWVEVNCRSVTAKEASEYLGYTAYSDGILLEGAGFQRQFKPDKPWGEGNKKPKYRSCKEDDGYDLMMPRHPDIKDFWDDLEIVKSKCYQIEGIPCLPLTEGFFKAISLMSHDIPCLSVLGVEMGLTSGDKDPQRRRYLVPTLEKLARAGFGFIIGFDADCATKQAVNDAQRKLAHQLALFKVPVYSITGLWVEAEGKGIDDYIQSNGAEKFKSEVLARAESIEKWEKQFFTEDGDEKKTKKIPPADVVARDIAEEYLDRLAYNNETSDWMLYESDHPGVWSRETQEYMEALISQILDTKGITGYSTHSYITNILKNLRCQPRIMQRKWIEKSPTEILPFLNGVLDVTSGKFLKHSPGYRLTWCLPRNHDSNAKDWDSIKDWLDFVSNGNTSIKNILLCYANAILKGRYDLQKFLHLIGIGGSGKGTYGRLIVDLIGQQNVFSSTLESFCSNRFEPADAYRKRLTVFWDEDKGVRNLSRFRSLTGGDWIRGEEKGKKGFQFRYDGMVLMMSNFPIFAGENLSWLSRRMIQVPFSQRVNDVKRRDLNEDFQEELPAFTNYLLSLDDAFVTTTLRGIADIPELSLQAWDSRVREDGIAQWFNDCIIVDAGAKTATGNDSESSETLYGSYCTYSKRAGNLQKAVKQFSPDLEELCQTILGLPVARTRSNNARCFSGLRLRIAGQDDHIPNYDVWLEQQILNFQNRDGSSDGLSDGLSDGSEPLHRGDVTDSDGSKQIIPTEIQKNLEQEIDPEIPPPKFTAGDFVKIVSPQFDSDQNVGKVGEIVEVNWDKYTKNWDYKINVEESETPIYRFERYLIKSKPSQQQSEVWFLNNLQSDKLTTAQKNALRVFNKVFTLPPVDYKTPEEFLKDWNGLKPKERFWIELLIKHSETGVKFSQALSKRHGISLEKLGIEIKKPTDEGDQLSLLNP